MRKLQRDWERSPVRILVPALLAYSVTSGYYWISGFSDPWMRGIAPVLGIITYSIAMPMVKNGWFRRSREKIPMKRAESVATSEDVKVVSSEEGQMPQRTSKTL